MGLDKTISEVFQHQTNIKTPKFINETYLFVNMMGGQNPEISSEEIAELKRRLNPYPILD